MANRRVDGRVMIGCKHPEKANAQMQTKFKVNAYDSNTHDAMTLTRAPAAYTPSVRLCFRNGSVGNGIMQTRRGSYWEGGRLILDELI